MSEREGVAPPAAGGAPRALDEAPGLGWSARAPASIDDLSVSWTSFTGATREALLGDGWLACVHPEDVARAVGIRTTSFQASSPFTLDLRLRRHDGVFRWMQDSGEPRPGADGAQLGYVGTMLDIDARKAGEEDLAERTKALRLAERRQGAFLARLSHEMRGPLAPIGNAASVLGTLEHTNPILARLRQILDRQVGRLSRMVAGLVEATRAAQGQISLVREQVPVESIVQAATASASDTVERARQRLEIEQPAERLVVDGDRDRLAQALCHLIANAAHHSPEPGVIRLAVRKVAQTVQIAVRDQGRGIDPSFLPHAFELFAQEPRDEPLNRSGLGVGLTLARKIAQLHGGDVEGFSEGHGSGAEFVLWLPLARAAEEAAPENPHETRLDQRFRVLIVEDHADARESLKLSMELWGNEVWTAADAAEAVAQARSAQPEIVLCDIGLPDVDGYRLVEPIRAALDGRPALFVAVTGYATGDDRRRADEAGFDAFLVKPLNAESLARVLRSAAAR